MEKMEFTESFINNLPCFTIPINGKNTKVRYDKESKIIFQLGKDGNTWTGNYYPCPERLTLSDTEMLNEFSLVKEESRPINDKGKSVKSTNEVDPKSEEPKQFTLDPKVKKLLVGGFSIFVLFGLVIPVIINVIKLTINGI